MQHDNSPSESFEKEYADLVDLAVHDLDAPLRKLTLLVGMLTSKLLADKDTAIIRRTHSKLCRRYEIIDRRSFGFGKDQSGK